MNDFGKRLKTLRERKGLKQSEFAQIIGVKSSAVISNWENGVNKPDLEKLTVICESLDTTFSYLLNYYGKEDKSLTLPEQTHIKKYRALDERGKETIDTLLDMEYNRISPIGKAEKETSAANDYIEQQLAEYRLELEAEQKGRKLSALRQSEGNAG